MMIHDITALAGPNKKRKRVGRGEGSGHGKQSGRGQKGASSRSGYTAKRSFEGGQMPYFRRLPKFGFTNAQFKVKFWTVNVGDIIAHPSFKSGGEVNRDSLIAAGLVRDGSRDLKVLGSLGKGQSGLKVKLSVTASRVSASARKMIEDAGGKVHEIGTRRDKVRGVDPNVPETKVKPKNLTKKLNRGGKGKKPAPAPAPAE
ncbi:MAG: 50S ribosomal protein L15 [Phycisphaerae bacterium]|nr:50S ribosomal protein L15 [Phycisphaerae bacterium]